MAPKAKPKTQTALVLQGGGAIGAYHLGVVKRLYQEPDFQPDIITGVSIGAFTAATLVGAKSGDPVAELEGLWRDFTVSAPYLTQAQEQAISTVTNFGIYRPRYDYWNSANWTSYYKTDPLYWTLSKHVDLDRLNNSPIAFACSALNVQTGDINYFRNRGGQSIQIKDVVASGSLPPGLPMVEIDGQAHWDGGMFDNTPLQPALDYLDPDPSVKKRIIIVALFPRKGKVPTNMNEVFERKTELSLANPMQADLDRLHHTNELIELLEALEGDARDKALTSSRLFKQASEATYLHDIVQITDTSPEGADGMFDFSAASIERRIAAGYADADAMLSGLDKAA